jgi:uncharacterized protein YggU (UPF0235/DUF167 family)
VAGNETNVKEDGKANREISLIVSKTLQLMGSLKTAKKYERC